MALDQRVIRPVIVIAYGARGADWLRRLRSLVLNEAGMSRLVEREVLQFWAVAAEETTEGILAAGSSVAVDWVRDRISGAFSARNRAFFPTLELHAPLVLERWSIAESPIQARLTLGKVMDEGRRHGSEPTASPFTHFDWLELADLVRPLGDPARDVVEAARKLSALTCPRRTLVIDQSDAAGALLDAGLADECFLHLALAFATSDVAFRRIGTNADQGSAVLSDPHQPAVIPCGIVTLVHDNEAVDTARHDAVLQAIARNRTSSHAPPPPIGTLSELLANDVSGWSQPGFDPGSSRVRRDERRRTLLTHLCRSGNKAAVLAEVEAARKSIDAYAPAATVGGLVMLSDLEIGLITALLLGASAFAGWLLLRRRGTSAANGEAGATGYDHGVAARREWTAMLEDLTKIVRAWEPAQPPRAPSSQWEMRQAYVWELVPNAAAVELPVGFDPCAELAAELADTESQTAVRRVASRLGNRPLVRSRLVQAAFSAEATGNLRAGLAASPLMAALPGVARTREILWISSYADTLAASQDHLEPEQNSIVRFLESEDSDHSYRIRLGQSTSWAELPSLSFLRNK